jgi:8-oxo-dGTP pyrophosphatase MutT (NUDIX family)
VTAVVEIVHLRGIDARFEAARWDFADDRRPEIEAFWAESIATNPDLFNGTVLLQHRWTLDDGVYRAAYSPVDYASFIAWPRLGKPGAPRRNGFAMPALRAADGPFLLGVMGPRTYNAGKIYFPAGTPDMDDVTADGRVDLAGSMVRELIEETALRRDEFEIAPDWTLALDSHRAAFLREARVAYPAEEARRLIRGRLASETDQELSDIAIVRRPEDIDEARTPGFAAVYMRAAFAAG